MTTGALAWSGCLHCWRPQSVAVSKGGFGAKPVRVVADSDQPRRLRFSNAEFHRRASSIRVPVSRTSSPMTRFDWSAHDLADVRAFPGRPGEVVAYRQPPTWGDGSGAVAAMTPVAAPER